MAQQTVLILDFGGQYKELIARRVRECNVYSVVKPGDRITVEQILEKQDYLKRRMRRKHITFQWHDSKTSQLEGCFARGDRLLGDVLEKGYRLGCRLDGWREQFRHDLWQQAFDASGVSMRHYAQYAPALDDVLPYDHLSVGVTKAFLRSEYEKALGADVTPDCRKGCHACGLEAICHG